MKPNPPAHHVNDTVRIITHSVKERFQNGTVVEVRFSERAGYWKTKVKIPNREIMVWCASHNLRKVETPEPLEADAGIEHSPTPAPTPEIEIATRSSAFDAGVTT